MLGCLAAVPAAQAAPGITVTPVFPASVQAGDTGHAASVTVTAIGDRPPFSIDGTHFIGLCGATPQNPESGCDVIGAPWNSGVTLTPSCAQSGAPVIEAPTCQAADPGVFTLNSGATGAIGTACAGTSFAITTIDAATGTVKFTPFPASSSILLGGPGSKCQINFTFNVAPGATNLQTRSLATAGGWYAADADKKPAPLRAVGSTQTSFKQKVCDSTNSTPETTDDCPKVCDSTQATPEKTDDCPCDSTNATATTADDCPTACDSTQATPETTDDCPCDSTKATATTADDCPNPCDGTRATPETTDDCPCDDTNATKRDDCPDPCDSTKATKRTSDDCPCDDTNATKRKSDDCKNVISEKMRATLSDPPCLVARPGRAPQIGRARVTIDGDLDNVKSVRFIIDGRRTTTVRRPNAGALSPNTFLLRINAASGLKFERVHRVQALVKLRAPGTFRKGAVVRSKLLGPKFFQVSQFRDCVPERSPG